MSPMPNSEARKRAVEVGRCGDRSPALLPTACRLPHGHPGWHLGDDNSEWIHGAPSEPHAYVIEVLVNAGSVSEYWKLVDDTYDIQERSNDVAEAAQQRDLLIEAGYLPEHLRVVGLVIA